MGRALLDRLGEFVDGRLSRGGGVVLAILPTGYGKTSFVREKLLPRVAKGLRVAHVLPLRAIVEEAASRAAKRASDLKLEKGLVGYQAGIIVSGVDKSPYLARNYMIVTIDSFLLSFYGIPVYEMFRDKWHSDAAYMFARSFSLLLLDEFHLMVAGDAEQGEEEASLLAKQVAAVSEAIAEFVSHGRCVAVLTATLPPSIIRAVLELVAERLGSVRVWLVAYGDVDHLYTKTVIEAIRGVEGVTVVEQVVETDKEFYGERCGSIRTLLVPVPVKTVDVNGVSVRVLDLEAILEVVSSVLEEAHCSAKGLRVFFSFNSWRRAYASYIAYKDIVAEKFGCSDVVLINGKMNIEDRAGVSERISGKSVCLFATQVVEAGVDVDFDILVTEAAPATSLVQRAGRVARHRKPSSCNLVVIAYSSSEPTWTGRGVYDEKAVEETLRRLGGGSIPSNTYSTSIDWRCPGGRDLDAWSLIASVDKAVASKVEGNVAEAVKILNDIRRILLFTRPPLNTIKLLDTVFKGSFARSSSLIPVAPWEALEEADIKPDQLCKGASKTVGEDVLEKLTAATVSVDTGFLETYGASLLHECGDRIVAVVYGGGRVSARSARLDELVDKPLQTLWSLSRGVSLIGFLSKPNTYVKGLGLKPLKASRR